MTFFLAIVFLIQIGLIFYLRSKMLSERNAFQSKLKPLEEFMVQLNSEQSVQSVQLQVSDDLKLKMKEANAALSKNIFELNYQLLEDIYPKKENRD
jgi:RecB family endonuclease NucS